MIFGQSAGAISGESLIAMMFSMLMQRVDLVSLHMWDSFWYFLYCSLDFSHRIHNNGNNQGLFRGAFMESGAPVPTAHIEDGQLLYDLIVNQAGCAQSNDTLACLRRIPFYTLKSAVDSGPSLFGYNVTFQSW